MLPLLLMTDSKDEMGEFRNTGWVKVCGWLSVISLTFLNLYNLPNTFESFGIWQKSTSDLLAWIAIVVIIMLLAWTIYDMYKGNQRLIAEGIHHPWEHKDGQKPASQD